MLEDSVYNDSISMDLFSCGPMRLSLIVLLVLLVQCHGFHPMSQQLLGKQSYTKSHLGLFKTRHSSFNRRLSHGQWVSSPQPFPAFTAAALPSTTVFSNTLAGPGLAAMFTPPPNFQNNDIKPSFGDNSPTNVTVIRGRMAELKCAVLNLGTKSVSWVRHEDIHVLTVGRITFTNDERFVAHNTPGSNVWSIRIKFAQLRDTGKYECQVSVRPPLARVVQLNVVEPQAVIPPGRELFVDRGSPMNITCIVPDSPEPPRNVFWYHQSKMVTFDGSKEGVSVSTNKGQVTTSILRIPDVNLDDSGVYICSPEGMKEASVRVTVLHGELPQAMQTGSTCRACFGSHMLLLAIIAYLVGLPYLFHPVFEALASCHETVSVTRLCMRLNNANGKRAEPRNNKIPSTFIVPLSCVAEQTRAPSDHR